MIGLTELGRKNAEILRYAQNDRFHRLVADDRWFWQHSRSEAAAGVGAGAEVDDELDFFVGVHVPAEAMELWSLGGGADAGEAQALPAEARRLPGQPFPSPCMDRVEAGKDEQAVIWQRENLYDWAERDVRAMFRAGGVDDVCVTAGDGAKLLRVGAGVEACGHRGIGEAQGTRREEGRCFVLPTHRRWNRR